MPGLVGDSRSAHRWRRLRQAATYGAVSALVVFHVWLFVARLAAGRVSDPLVAMRWGAGLLLVFLLAALKQRGLSLVRSRSAAACWVLVLFLHWSALAPQPLQAPDLPAAALPGGVLVVLPVAGWLGALAGGLFLLLASRRRRVLGPRLAGTFTALDFSARRSPHLACPRSLRAPPVG
jgi:hypothetical protein